MTTSTKENTVTNSTDTTENPNDIVYCIEFHSPILNVDVHWGFLNQESVVRSANGLLHDHHEVRIYKCTRGYAEKNGVVIQMRDELEASGHVGG